MSVPLLTTVKPAKDEVEHYQADIPAIASGALYGLSMFVAGFAVGAIRVLYLEPWVGEWNAFLAEIPVMLPICWILSYQALLCWYFFNIVLTWADFQGKTHVDTISATSFITLITLEIAISMTLFHHTFAETKAQFATRIGAAGLAIQWLACSFPILQETIQERRMKAKPKAE